jgi:hypothetical protein
MSPYDPNNTHLNYINITLCPNLQQNTTDAACQQDITVKCWYTVIGKVNVTTSISVSKSLTHYTDDILGDGLLTFDNEDAH